MKKFFISVILLLIAFCFCSVTASAQKITRFGKEICQKYAELYYAGDEEALREFIDENMQMAGSGSSYEFPEEMLQALRDRSDMLIAINYEPNIYQWGSEITYPQKTWTYCRFDFITGDGSEYTVSYVLRESGTFIRSLKSIVSYCGIEDPENIVQASYICLGDDLKVTDRQFHDCKTGWNEVDGNRVYVQKNGFTATKSTTINGIRYKFDESGVCQGKYTGYTKSSKGKRYWKNGELLKNTWIKVKGERKYYAGADGYFVTGTRKINGKEYSFGENGALKK